MVASHSGASAALAIHISESLATSVISTVETVTHSEMRFTASRARSGILASMIPTSSAIHSPAMSAAIYSIEMWATEEEVVSTRIACIDSEMEISSVPIKRTIEIASRAEISILPIQEDVT